MVEVSDAVVQSVGAQFARGGLSFFREKQEELIEENPALADAIATSARQVADHFFLKFEDVDFSRSQETLIRQFLYDNLVHFTVMSYNCLKQQGIVNELNATYGRDN